MTVYLYSYSSCVENSESLVYIQARCCCSVLTIKAQCWLTKSVFSLFFSNQMTNQDHLSLCLCHQSLYWEHPAVPTAWDPELQWSPPTRKQVIWQQIYSDIVAFFTLGYICGVFMYKTFKFVSKMLWKMNRIHCLCWDSITFNFCDSTVMIFDILGRFVYLRQKLCQEKGNYII